MVAVEVESAVAARHLLSGGVGARWPHRLVESQRGQVCRGARRSRMAARSRGIARCGSHSPTATRSRSSISSRSANRSRIISRGRRKPDMWSWLEVFPQHVFTNSAGQKEQMSVGVAQNAVNGRLGSMSEAGRARPQLPPRRHRLAPGRGALRAECRRAMGARAQGRPALHFRHRLERVDRGPLRRVQSHQAAGDVRGSVRPRAQPRHRADARRPRRRLLLPVRELRPPLQGRASPARSRIAPDQD